MQILIIRSKPVAATYIGSGKAEEIADLVAHHQAGLVIFDHSISPIQERNLERKLKCRVVDRAALILDIFAQRASSSEGKLQVELAQLQHLSTRLVRGWTHLERQKGGIGLRGPGESQLETDRRLIGRRIKTLQSRLARVEAQRNLRRRARQRTPIPTVSLVGYTNTGKSSLFRALTGAQVLVEDKLFATLDPTMRRLEVPGFGGVVLSDTVGFVRDLPHALVAAFHSTLEEVASASCLILVSDISDPDHALLKAEVLRVLEEIGAGDIMVINVLNKIDITGDLPKVSVNNETAIVDKIWLSAEKHSGLENLLNALGGFLSRDHVMRKIVIQPSAGALRSRLYQKCEVLEETVDSENGNIYMRVKLDKATLGWLESQADDKGHWEIADVD